MAPQRAVRPAGRGTEPAGESPADQRNTHSGGPVGAGVKRSNGPFSRKVLSGEFAVTVEVIPPRGTAPGPLESKIDFVREVAASGLADAVDITDGSRGLPLVPPGDFITAVRSRLGWSAAAGDGIELITHFTSRDLNAIAIQARLLGYFLNRINNVIFLTGDAPSQAPGYPQATPVFDLDSVAMIRNTHSNLNAGMDFGGSPLGKHPDPRTHFTIGASFAPDSSNLDQELKKLDSKIDAGADYMLTQPLFRQEPMEVVRRAQERVPVLVGVMILSGAEQARRIGAIPGMNLPETLVQRIGSYDATEDQARAGAELAGNQLRRIRESGAAGAYVMSPASHKPVVDVLRQGLA